MGNSQTANPTKRQSTETDEFSSIVDEKWFNEVDAAVARVDAPLGATNFFNVTTKFLGSQLDQNQLPGLTDFLRGVQSGFQNEWDEALRGPAGRLFEEVRKRWVGGVRGSDHLLNHLSAELGQPWWDEVEAIYLNRLQGVSQGVLTMAVKYFKELQSASPAVELRSFLSRIKQHFGKPSWVYPLEPAMTSLHSSLTSLNVDHRRRLYQKLGLEDSSSSSPSVSVLLKPSSSVLDQVGLMSSVAQEARANVTLAPSGSDLDLNSSVSGKGLKRRRSSRLEAQQHDEDSASAKVPTRRQSSGRLRKSSSGAGSSGGDLPVQVRSVVTEVTTADDGDVVNETVVQTITDDGVVDRTVSMTRSASKGKRLTAEERLARQLSVDGFHKELSSTPLPPRRSDSLTSPSRPVRTSSSSRRLSKARESTATITESEGEESTGVNDPTPLADTIKSPSSGKLKSEPGSAVKRAKSQRSALQKLQRELTVDGFQTE